MNKQTLLKNIALILFGVVIILLILNIAITKYVEKDDQPKNREAISGIEVDSFFRTALSNYGFSDGWMAKKKLKNISGDSLYAAYSVSVPMDVPIPLIILELKKIFWESEVEIKAQELVSASKTLIKLFSGNQLKLAAELYYSENAKREYGTVSFLVSELPLEDVQLLHSFLDTPELFYVVLIPKDDSKQRLSNLSKSGKRYALLLDDNITELNYKLSGNYTSDKIKKSIREIVGTFYNAAFFIVDDKSDLYESANYPLIESELVKRGIVPVPISKFITLSTSKANTENNFNDFMKSLHKKDEKIILVSASEFSSILNLISSYRKIGYRFIYPGDILMKRNE